MQKTFNYAGSLVFYRVEGSGKPVILLHGIPLDATVWDDQVEKLKEQYLVIKPDLPGSGRSAMLKDGAASIIDFADCIDALLTVENIETCVMLGHSFGGYITLAYAEKYPDKLRGFGLVHSTAFADSDEKKESRKKALGTIEDKGLETFLRDTTPGMFSAGYKSEHGGLVEGIIKKASDFDKAGIVQYYKAIMERPDRTAILRQAKVPVLFIIGSEDKAAPKEDVLKQVHLPNLSHVHLIDGVGHVSMFERPAELNEYLVEYLESIKY